MDSQSYHLMKLVDVEREGSRILFSFESDSGTRTQIDVLSTVQELQKEIDRLHRWVSASYDTGYIYEVPGKGYYGSLNLRLVTHAFEPIPGFVKSQTGSLLTTDEANRRLAEVKENEDRLSMARLDLDYLRERYHQVASGATIKDIKTSTKIRKRMIRWVGTENQLVYLIHLLTEKGLVYEDFHAFKWKFVVDNFVNDNYRLFDERQLASTLTKLGKKIKKFRGKDRIDDLLSNTSSIEGIDSI